MNLRVLLFIAAIVCLALLGARGLTPPRPTASGTIGRGPTIVLIHGLGSSASHWVPAARLLAQRHRVVLVDLPGHGASEMPEPLTLERAAQALDLALATDAPIPCILVGHSVGGLVAAVEALDHPERVRGLVLVETALKPQVDAHQRAALLDAIARDYAGTLHSVYVSFGRDSAQGEALYGEARQLDPAMMKAWIRLAVTSDLSGRATSFTVPMLVVLSARSWPDGEPWAPTAEAHGYGGVPRLESVRIEDAGHFVMLDHPEQVAAAIERFTAHPEADLVAGR